MVPGLSHCSSCNNFLITADVTFQAACLTEEEEEEEEEEGEEEEEEEEEEEQE